MCEGKPEFCEDKAENLWRQVSEMCGSLFCCSIIWTRAHIFIRTFCSEKAFTRSPAVIFSVDFHQFWVWRLAPWSIHVSVSCCENFTPLPFTPETNENQQETSIMWRREHFFRLKNSVYKKTRRRRGRGKTSRFFCPGEVAEETRVVQKNSSLGKRCIRWRNFPVFQHETEQPSFFRSTFVLRSDKHLNSPKPKKMWTFKIITVR